MSSRAEKKRVIELLRKITECKKTISDCKLEIEHQKESIFFMERAIGNSDVYHDCSVSL